MRQIHSRKTVLKHLVDEAAKTGTQTAVNTAIRQVQSNKKVLQNLVNQAARRGTQTAVDTFRSNVGNLAEHAAYKGIKGAGRGIKRLWSDTVTNPIQQKAQGIDFSKNLLKKLTSFQKGGMWSCYSFMNDPIANMKFANHSQSNGNVA